MTRQKLSRVCIVYPADPVGVIPGGIDTFIRGILRWAPDDIQMRLVGATTDPEKRPVGKWTTCYLGGHDFEFFPLLELKQSGKQAKMPVTLRFLAALLLHKPEMPADVLEFHRIEPCLAFLRDGRPMTLVMHQNMEVVRSTDSDIRWRYFPNLYFKLEDYVLPRMGSIFCVREDATQSYRQRYSPLSDQIHFTPTWVDTQIFQPPTDAERSHNKKLLRAEFGFGQDDKVLVAVGRLDRQKNPLLLLEAFQQVHRSNVNARLLCVGDGVLRGHMQDRIKYYQLESQVRLCGVKPASDIARYLQSSDAFVLSSAYEGMPICVLEALGCGLPVVSTDVGEVSRVVKPERNGELVTVHEPETLSNAILRCLTNSERYRGKPCLDAVVNYTPHKVLVPVYENYRRLSGQRGVVVGEVDDI